MSLPKPIHVFEGEPVIRRIRGVELAFAYNIANDDYIGWLRLPTGKLKLQQPTCEAIIAAAEQQVDAFLEHAQQRRA